MGILKRIQTTIAYGMSIERIYIIPKDDMKSIEFQIMNL